MGSAVRHTSSKQKGTIVSENTTATETKTAKTEEKTEVKEPSFQVLRGRCIRAIVKEAAGQLNLKSKDFEVIDTHKTGGDAKERSYDVWVEYKTEDGKKHRLQGSATTNIARGTTHVVAIKDVGEKANAQSK